MEIFEQEDRVNFVDENDVVVGYDMYSQCCEDYGYFFASKPEYLDVGHRLKSENLFMKDYVFDKDFFQDVSGPEECDCENAIAFRLTNSKAEEIFLILYNVHNGYYSHGFDVKVGGQVMKSGSL